MTHSRIFWFAIVLFVVIALWIAAPVFAQTPIARVYQAQVGELLDVTFIAPNWEETELDYATYQQSMGTAWRGVLDRVQATGKPARVFRCEKMSPSFADCTQIIIVNSLIPNPP